MTRTERAIVEHWRGLAVLCAIVTLFGIAVVLWHRIDASDRRAAAAAAEANRRGNAVSTLATDVRRLRAQVQAAGKKPVAPDPSRAVSNLPARTTVPVPIPGPVGPSGAAGKGGASGSPGAVGSPGPSGASGVPGVVGPAGPTGPTGPAGPPGTTGAAGKDGVDGKDGRDGRDGQTCPDGYSLQAPADDPDALVCRRDGAPDPTPSPSGLAMAALPPDRRRI